MKRHWVYKYQESKVIGDLLPQPNHNTCAICRLELNSLCDQCMIFLSSQLRSDRQEFYQKILFTLLMIYKRQGSFLAVAGIPIVHKIMSFYMQEYSYTVHAEVYSCNVLHMRCGHFFHGHCMEGWMERSRGRPCPLCNSAYTPLNVFFNGAVIFNLATLTLVETQDGVYVPAYLKREHTKAARQFVANYLCINGPSFVQDIYIHYLAFFSRMVHFSKVKCNDLEEAVLMANTVYYAKNESTGKWFLTE
jgi:hypothetical protein